MQIMTLADVALATAGAPRKGAMEIGVGNICTDTRKLRRGDFFVPLCGKNFEGHAFLKDALAAGASGCVLRADWAGKDLFFAAAPDDFGIIEVEECNQAYGAIARYYRSLFFDLSVVGVTGSNGKSTSKEMIAALLSQRFRVLKNEGTLNNLVGVPQTLLRLDWETQIAVLEMGTSLPGEIAALTHIARPDVGVLTNVGPSHLEFFGDLDGVALEKGALAEGVNPKGAFVVFTDDAKAWSTAERTQAKIVGFGFADHADVRATDAMLGADGCWSFQAHVAATGEVATMRLGVLGRHNIGNALAAIAVASHYGMTLAEMQPALESFHGLAMRMQVIAQGGVTFLNDAYNANPQSFAKALEAFSGMSAKGRKILVMGDMLELGAMEEEAHVRAGELIASSDVAVLVAVGKRAAWSAERCTQGKRSDQKVFSFSDAAAARGFLSELLRDGDLVLLKGSRGMKLETLLERQLACS